MQRTEVPQMTRLGQSSGRNRSHTFSTLEVVSVSPRLVRFGGFGGFVLLCFVLLVSVS